MNCSNQHQSFPSMDYSHYVVTHVMGATQNLHGGYPLERIMIKSFKGDQMGQTITQIFVVTVHQDS